MAPARAASEILGPILPEIAQRTGLPPGTMVHCGIHDSNPSLLPHILMRDAPFSVISTGTWVIAMAIGGAPERLDPDRDTLLNVSALGDPVPSARFMGGRAFETIISGQYTEPAASHLDHVLTHGVMLLPAVIQDSGPFRGQQARWINGEPGLGTGQRAAAAGFTSR